MKHTKWVHGAALLSAAIALSLAYGLERFWLGVILVLIIGFLGWLGYRLPRQGWSNDLFLTSAIILITLGALLGLSQYFLLFASLGTIAAWDVARFQQRIGDVAVTSAIFKIEKRHLILLISVLICGGIWAVVILNFQARLSFGVALTLGVILVITLGQIFRQLRNS